jgi:hypothetical protein
MRRHTSSFHSRHNAKLTAWQVRLLRDRFLHTSLPVMRFARYEQVRLLRDDGLQISLNSIREAARGDTFATIR